MAISRIQPVIILLASLFFLPSLLAVDFEYCNKSGYDFGNVSRVEISPNPVGPDDDPTFTIFGYANQELSYGSIKVYVKAGDIIHSVNRYFLCVVGIECAIEAGTNFVLPLTDVPQDYIEGATKYVYSVNLVDEDKEDEPIVRMCVEFELPTSEANTLVSA